jgi:dolichol-phosphate mannosyltransferase
LAGSIAIRLELIEGTSMTVILALPAYNEELGLPKLLETFGGEMKKAGLSPKVVIVDDGSGDGTGDVILEWSSRLPIDLVKHSENRGLGETIRDALRRASEVAEADDVIVTMDADNTHSPALIPEMLRLIGAGNDMVIASRYRKGSRVIGLSWYRHLMSYGARVLFQIVFPIPHVRDYTCGFRAYRADALRKAFAVYGDGFVTERSFACMAEILLRMRKLSLKIAEVPMVLRYDRKEGASKMKVARTVSRTLRLMLRIRFSS